MDERLTFEDEPIQPNYLYTPYIERLEQILRVRENVSLQVSPMKGKVTAASIGFFDPSGTNRSLWITVGAKKTKLEWKSTYLFTVDSFGEYYKDAELKNGKRIVESLSCPSDLKRFEQLILDIYDYRERETKGKLFDCCHRYLECSNQRRCIHPDQEMAACCTYRRKLLQGVIFFGENRTVE